MTREEAKRRLECCRNFLANNYSDMGEPNVKAFNMGIEALEQEPKTEWIPVSEALPPNDENVLAVYQNGRMEVVYYHIDSAFYPIEYADENETGWYDWDDEALCDEPIAWMPLPKAYEEG